MGGWSSTYSIGRAALSPARRFAGVFIRPAARWGQRGPTLRQSARQVLGSGSGDLWTARPKLFSWAHSSIAEGGTYGVEMCAPYGTTVGGGLIAAPRRSMRPRATRSDQARVDPIGIQLSSARTCAAFSLRLLLRKPAEFL